jgi:hypothetical protein
VTSADLIMAGAAFLGNAVGAAVIQARNGRQLRSAVQNHGERIAALEDASDHRDQRDGRVPTFLQLAKARVAR